ncbi:MAG: helix-turn-helix transcriptional regulator [Rubrivivax sp.]|nr:helix-turn-helix transcriptional regulator [Rubrivivax sp.]
MPNIAQLLREEVSRVARKQSRAEVASLRRTVARQRSDVAALKRQVADLTQKLSAMQKQRRSVAPEPETPMAAVRFSAKGLASHRRRLGLSAAELGRMFGVSGQTIYIWESGRARPRPGHMPAIAALRTLGRKQAAAVLASLP